MKNKKIKLLIERGAMRCIESTIAIVENTLDENYKLIKSKKVEILYMIHFNYEWINKEKDQLFFEVSQWEHLFRSLCDQYGGKTIKANIFACVLPVNQETIQAVKSACVNLQNKLNLGAL